MSTPSRTSTRPGSRQKSTYEVERAQNVHRTIMMG